MTGPAIGGQWINGRWVSGPDVPSALAESGHEESREEPARRFPIPSNWEIGAYAALFVSALLMRLWDLGTRAVHHDESLHGYFAWQIFQGNGYDHNPLTHGMFLFHTLAGTFFLFGDNDYTLRLPMALFGAGLILIPLALRPRLGQVGALAAALMLTFSPALLYFSRFSRNDIFMAVFTLALVAVMWRYLDERKNRYLYIAAALLALGFTTKETQFIVVAIVSVALLVMARSDIGQWIWGRRSIKDWGPAAQFLLVVAALSAPLFGPSAAIFQDLLGITLAAPDGTPGVASGAPLVGAGLVVAAVISVFLVVAAMALGLLWRPRVWLIAWAVFAAIFVTIFTNFYSNPEGFATGLWQSLGYWLAQHDVARGGQPRYYYAMTASVYEFLPLFIAVGASIYYTFRGDAFSRFLVFWAVATFVAYSLAGEKMPWLLVNVTLPLIILAAKAINDMALTIPWRRAMRSGIWMVAIGTPLFLLILWRLAFFEFNDGWFSFITLWAALAALGVLFLGLQWLARHIGWKPALSGVALSLAVVMFAFTVRASWVATYVHSDVPKEMLVYVQSSPELARVAKEIETVAALTGDWEEVNVTIDTVDSFAWPWHWYLRNHTAITFKDYTREPSFNDENLVAVIAARNQARVEDEMGEDYTSGRRIPHRWWFPEEYRGLTLGKFLGSFVDREAWRNSIDYFLYRKLSNPLGSIDSYVYYREDIPLTPMQ